jgi:acetylornithine deacetylase/succinyl-diaminopimelate desuccinylase-like protein
MKQLLDEARRMIRMSSVSSSGNEELANYCAGLLQERGFKTQLQQVLHSHDGVSKRQFNVIGILGDPLVDKKTRKGLLLNTHLDTVGPGLPENWTETGGDPFAATIKDGKVYGLGSAEAKLDLLTQIRAAEKYRERKLKQPIYVVGTCGEELGMFGAKYLIKSLALNPKYVVVSAPSELKLVYAHKSMAQYRVSIGYQLVERDARGFNRRIDLHSFGKSAHGSYPHLGTNSILQAADFLQLAAENGFEMRFTKLDGGDTVNRVPDRAMAEFYLTSHQFEDFKRFFRETVKMQSKERAFRVELGGLGDMGVRFLPDPVFKCLSEVVALFRVLTTEFEAKKDDGFNPPHSTVNLGQLKQRHGGMDLQFDLRLLPDVPPAEVEKRIAQGVQAIAARYPSLNVASSRERLNPGLAMTPEHELVKLCSEAMRAAGLEPLLDRKSTATEAAQFFHAGYEAVAFGPGVSLGNSHSPNEHNVLEQLEKATLFYDRLIEKACL